jgi:hypothetical protein
MFGIIPNRILQNVDPRVPGVVVDQWEGDAGNTCDHLTNDMLNLPYEH